MVLDWSEGERGMKKHKRQIIFWLENKRQMHNRSTHADAKYPCERMSTVLTRASFATECQPARERAEFDSYHGARV